MAKYGQKRWILELWWTRRVGVEQDKTLCAEIFETDFSGEKKVEDFDLSRKLIKDFADCNTPQCYAVALAKRFNKDQQSNKVHLTIKSRYSGYESVTHVNSQKAIETRIFLPLSGDELAYATISFYESLKPMPNSGINRKSATEEYLKEIDKGRPKGRVSDVIVR